MAIQRSLPSPGSAERATLTGFLAEVEANWFRPLLSGTEMGGIWAPGLDIEVAFREAAVASVAEAFRVWQAGCEHARELVAAVPTCAPQRAR
jgi:hypothetical protein